MNILSLDLGTNTGYAYRLSSGSEMFGTWSFKPGRFDGGGIRFLKFQRQLVQIHELLGLEMVVFEEVRRHSSTDAAHCFGGLMAHLTSFCEERGIPYQGIPVGTIKKFWTGSGNAPKEKMMAVAAERGYPVGDDNQADAIALLHYALEELV